MIYFFSKEQEYVQCELHYAAPCVFRMVQPDGREATERYSSPRHLEERWAAVQSELWRDGWTGPYGRDGRS